MLHWYCSLKELPVSDLPQSLIEKLCGQIRTELGELQRLAESTAVDQQSVELDQQRFGRLSRIDALQGQAMAIASGNLRALRIKRLEAALDRLDQGEYGHCAKCDETISPKRLEADPAAPLCVACASGSEC